VILTPQYPWQLTWPSHRNGVGESQESNY
jgi:hypothetical protein